VSDLRFHVYETSRGSAADTYEQRELFFDGFDRLRSQQYTRVLGAWTTETFQYDGLGRLVSRYRPYSSGSNGYFAWNYDVHDRVVAAKLYQPGGALDRATTFGYSGRTTRITDVLGRTRTQVADVTGRLRQLVDPSPGGTTYYDYDSFGGLVRAQDPVGAVSTATYNLRGFRTGWTDADRGAWTFSGNSLNEFVSWTDAKGQSFSMAYDALGRVTSRTEPEGTSTWIWGTSSAARNIGRLLTVSGYGYTESRAYDAVGRIATRTIATDQSYQYDYSYNSIGALDTISYPSSPVPAGQSGARFKLRYTYSYGAPVQITDITQSAAKTLWTLGAANDDSFATSETLGASLLTVSSSYTPWSGELTSRQSGLLPATSNRQNLAYQWDVAGNLTQRRDLNQSLAESFTLDGLDRVVSATLNGSSNLSVAYDAAGNIRSRSDVGTYSYTDAAHPHAVTAAGSRRFSYDANGNQLTRDGATQGWASFNLPTLLAQPSGGTTYQTQLSYGPQHERWKQVATYSNGTETTLYVGGLLERESTTSTGKTYWRHYVHTPSGHTVVVSRNSDGSASTSYVLTDHLGSSEAVLDSSGNVTARASFAAFGGRRGGNWSSGTAPDWAGIANSTRHGYTGHEHLDNVGLIHMNGRVYDPVAGRFLSVDPLIGDLADSQTLNPYAYVGNRPLAYTDPSGLDGVCGGMCAAAVFSVAKTVSGLLAGGDRPEPPPATVLPGQSAQSGVGLCGPGTSTPTCAGVVLYAGAAAMDSGVPSSTWAASGRSGQLAPRGYPGEPGARAAAAGLILAQDPDMPTAVKLGAPVVLVVGTGAALLCAESGPICGVIVASVDVGLTAHSDLPMLGPAAAGAKAGLASIPVAGSVPAELARVVAGKRPLTTLGRPDAEDVFVVAAEDIAGMNATQIAERLTIPQAAAFTVIRFPTPETGLASPVFRTNPGFVQGGLTRGGAREYVIPNGRIPPGAKTTVIDQ
jgi:RHS repeat-associated protein